MDELKRKIDPIIEEKNRAQEIIAAGRRHLASKHLTTMRAEYFLNKIEKAYS